jgi:hypothetical protein
MLTATNKADVRHDGRCENRNMCVYYSRRCNDQMFVEGCTHREMTMELKHSNGIAYHRNTDTRES